MSRLFKRGKVWHGYWRDAKGKKQRGSLRTSDRGIAAQRLREREAESPDRRSQAQGKALGDALTYLLDTVYAGRADATVLCYAQKAQNLIRLLGEHTPVTAISREDVLGYRAARLREFVPRTERTISPGTVYKELVVLRLALKEQGIEGVVPAVSAKYVPRKLAITPQQAFSLLQTLKPHRRLWLMTAVYAGARLSELAGLDWADVDLGGGWLNVRGTKTKGSARRTPISRELRPWLEAVEEGERVGLVLAPWPNYNRDLKAACARVAVPACTANDLRRTFASWLKRNGVDSLVAAKMMGTSVRMLEMVYAQLDDDTFQRAIERLPGCAPGVPASVPDRANMAAVARAETGLSGGKGAKSLESGAPTVGLEPTTRGLTVPALFAVPPTGKRRAR
jgi:integrase